MRMRLALVCLGMIGLGTLSLFIWDKYETHLHQSVSTSLNPDKEPYMTGEDLTGEALKKVLSRDSEGLTSNYEYGDDRNGRHIGKIISISKESNVVLKIKYAHWHICECPDGFRIAQGTSSPKVIRVRSDAKVIFQTYSWTASRNFNVKQVAPLAVFMSVFNNPHLGSRDEPPYDPKQHYYWITIKDGAVDEIYEQYQP